MKLATSLVAVKKITSAVDRSSFDENALNNTAKLILEVEGIINPLIVRRINLESYEVVDGHFEYYAAVKAKEIEPRKGEMIGAFIIEPENEEFIIEQVKYLRIRESDRTVAQVKMEQIAGVAEEIIPSNNGIEEVKSQIKQVEISFDQQLKELQNKVDQVLNKISDLSDKTPTKKKKEDLIINIETATQKEFEEAMANKTQGEAAWKAVKYLKEQDRSINKENLMQLVKAKKAPDKIKGFGEKVCENFIQIANITD